jgi:single-strand DNA-binding protein
VCLLAEPALIYSCGRPTKVYRFALIHLAVDQGKKEPLWLSVVAWRTLATQVEKYVTKGSLVLVAGRLLVETYTDRQNQKQTGVEVVALDVRFLDQSLRQTHTSIVAAIDRCLGEVVCFHTVFHEQ